MKLMSSRNLLRFAIVVLLPFMFLYGPVASAKSTAPQAAPAPRQGLAQVDDETPLSELPSAFKGVGLGAGIVPFLKTPTEVDPSLPFGEARAEFPDTAFGTGYVFNPGLVARASFATSVGIRVPTEVACSQPGGRESEQFDSGEKNEWNGQIRVGGGAVKASCAEGPATVTSGYLYNVVFVTSPVSQGAEPPGQTAILAVGFVSTISRSVFRSDGLAVDVVAELKDVNIGALGQVHFDSIRVEASALTDGSSDPITTTKVTFIEGRRSTQTVTADPGPAIAAANTALRGSGLLIRAGEQTRSTSEDKTSAEARAIGLVIQGATRQEVNAALGGERSFSIALGSASAVSHVTPNPLAADEFEEGPTTTFEEPSIGPPLLESAPALELPDAPTSARPLAGGSFTLGLDWSAFKIKGLPAEQSAAAWGGIGLVGGGMFLIRRRLFSF